jgi:predicted transposase YdaD
MRRKNDALWKGILEEVFDDLLRFIFPNADQTFNMEKGFEFLDKELLELYPEPDQRSDTRYVDKLVRAFQRDGNEEWLLLHIEVQGNPDKGFGERMFRYYYRIFDRYQMPVSAIAIYTGPDGREMPDRFERGFMGTHLTYRYNTFCVMDLSDVSLGESENPFALVVLTAKKALLAGNISDLDLLEQKSKIARLLYKKGLFSKKKIQSVLIFLNNYVIFENQELNRIFMQQLDQITGKKNTMGILEQIAEMRAEEALEKGLEKGRAEGVEMNGRMVARTLLEDTDFPMEKIASITNVSLDVVKTIKEELKAK